MSKPETTVNAITKIRSRLLSLSESERRVAEWVLEFKERVIYLSMSQIAQECNVSDTTVLRMCRSAGFDGFTHLKLSLAQDLASPEQLIHGNIVDGDGPAAVAHKVFLSNIQALYDTLEILDETALVKGVQAVENARHILIAGVGGSSIVAQATYQRFSRVGLQCDAPQDIQLQVAHAALLGEQDLAIAISYSGVTRDVVLVLQQAKMHGATTLAITGNGQSPLSRLADISLASVSYETRSDPIAARVAQMTLLDALYIIYSFRHVEETIKAEKRIASAIVSKSI